MSFYIHCQIVLLIKGLVVHRDVELIKILFSSSSRTISITNTTSITLDLSSVSFLTSLLFVSPCISLIDFLSIAFSSTDSAFGHITGIFHKIKYYLFLNKNIIHLALCFHIECNISNSFTVFPTKKCRLDRILCAMCSQE